MDKLFDNYILPTLGTIITVMVPWVLHRIITFLNNKIDMNISTQEETDLDKTIEDAIYAVEEKAAYECKRGLKTWGPIEKHEWAINFVLRFMPHIDQQKIEDLLNAKLGQPYIKAGATNNANK